MQANRGVVLMGSKKFNFAKKSAIALAISAVMIGAEATESKVTTSGLEVISNQVLTLDSAANLLMEVNLSNQSLLAYHSSHSSHASHGSHGSHSSHSSGG